MTVKELSSYLNSYLDPNKIEENAFNGIQISNDGDIKKIATAVSSSLETIDKAIELGAQALIVHHGIFTKRDFAPIIGIKYEKVKKLIENNIALLGYHLPLDAHQEIGNNWKAARDIGLENLHTFLEYNIGVIGTIEPIEFSDFKKKIENYYGHKATEVKVKDTIKSVAIVSGAGERFIKDAALAGADCYITGRFDEPTWDDAYENNISFLALGHYATETVGVKALAEYIKKNLKIECSFISTNNPF